MKNVETVPKIVRLCYKLLSSYWSKLLDAPSALAYRAPLTIPYGLPALTRTTLPLNPWGNIEKLPLFTRRQAITAIFACPEGATLLILCFLPDSAWTTRFFRTPDNPTSEHTNIECSRNTLSTVEHSV